MVTYSTLSHYFIVFQSKRRPVVLHVVKCLLQRAQLVFVLDLEVGSVLQKEEAQFLGILLVAVEIAHDEVERRIAFVIDAVQVLDGVEIFDLFELLDYLVGNTEVLARESHMKGSSIFHRLLRQAQLWLIKKQMHNDVLLVSQRQYERRRKVPVDGIQELVLGLHVPE